VLVPSYTNHSVTFFSFLANSCAEITLLIGVLIQLWLSGLESILIVGRYGSTRAKSVEINGVGAELQIILSPYWAFSANSSPTKAADSPEHQNERLFSSSSQQEKQL
jgi:hypothetical protein